MTTRWMKQCSRRPGSKRATSWSSSGPNRSVSSDRPASTDPSGCSLNCSGMVENSWAFRELSGWAEAGCIPGRFRFPKSHFQSIYSIHQPQHSKSIISIFKPDRDRGCGVEWMTRKAVLLHRVVLDLAVNPGPDHV